MSILSRREENSMSTTASTRSTSSARPAPAATRPRSIDGIYRAPPLHWVGNGFRVAGYLQAIPDAVRKLSPFLLLDYHPPYDYAPTSTPRGVGVHPHRGFETVTLAWQGAVAHHDSAGGGGVIGPGDVQWMTAASGVLHKEYHEAVYSRTGGPFHMAQLWVNLPAAHKMDPPRYQALLADQMGVVALPGGRGDVRVVAGEYRGVRGPARTFSPIDLYDVRLSPGGALDLSFPAHHTAEVLVMKGEIEVLGRAGREGDLVLFARDGEEIAIEAHSDAHVLVLSGEPIDEPVVQYGPFVMNTQRQIVEAIDDFERGAFGRLDD
jgi:quercetin 2,3-dioxygenase